MSIIRRVRKRPVISGVIVAIAVWAIALPTALADVPAPETSNPTVPNSCGLNVALVVDESGSIGGYFGPTEPNETDFTENVRGALRDVVAGLSGTGSSLFITEFADNGNVGLAPTVVDGNEAAIESYIANSYDPRARGLTGEFHTNWEAGLEVVRNAVTAGTYDPDIVIMVTDGIANKRYPRALFSGGFVNGVAEDFAGINGFFSPVDEGPAVDEAVDEGNWLKQQDIRLMGVGINLNDRGESSLSRVIGPVAWDGNPGTLGQSDYVNLADFSDLNEALASIATHGCNISVSIDKTELVNEDTTAGEGWEFTAELSEDPSTWIMPASATGTTATATTNADGEAYFSWMPTDVAATSHGVTLTETLQDDWENDSFVCSAVDLNGEAVDIATDGTTGSVAITGLAAGTHVSCAVVNSFVDQTTTTTTTTTVVETTTTVPETTTTVPVEVEGTTTIPVEEVTTTVPTDIGGITEERPSDPPATEVAGTQQERLARTGTAFPVPVAVLLLGAGALFLAASSVLRRVEAD